MLPGTLSFLKPRKLTSAKWKEQPQIAVGLDRLKIRFHVHLCCVTSLNWYFSQALTVLSYHCLY